MTSVALLLPLSIIEMALRLTPEAFANRSCDILISSRRFFSAAANRPENSWEDVSFKADHYSARNLHRYVTNVTGTARWQTVVTTA